MDCLSASPSSTITGSCSGSEALCALEILDCHNEPAWDLYDTLPCNPEHALFASTICEYTDIAGFPIEVRVLIAEQERLWGEDPNAGLADPMITKAVYEPSEETSILNVWGIVADDTMQYIVIPFTTWTRDVGPIYSLTPELSARPPIPQVGDVIKTLFNDRNYEITDVGSEQAIFMGKKFAWELIVKPFRYSDQSTGHRDVHMGLEDDPFATMVPHPSGGDAEVPMEQYTEKRFGDNEFVEEQSNEIDDYRDVDDPDKGAFGF